MRLFKFLATFLIVIGIVYLFVFGLNWKVFSTVFENQEALAEGSEWVEKTYSLSGLTEFVAANPEYVSVVMLPVDATPFDKATKDAEIHQVSYTTSTPEVLSQPILFEENTLRSYGGIGHIFLLLAYADAVANGDLSPDYSVPISEIERFFIPGIEPNRHKEAFALLDRLELINDGNTSIDHVVKLAIQRNHQPSADWLYHFFGIETISDLVKKHLGDDAEVPVTWSSLHIAANLSEFEPAQDYKNVDRTSVISRANRVFDELSQSTISAASLIRNDKKRKFAYTFREERFVYAHMPKVNPLNLAKAFEGMMKAERVSREESEILKRHLGWPMENDKVRRDFTGYAALFDSRISISSGLSIGTSVYTGESYVTAIFFDLLPIGFWMHLSSNLINQDFQMRLAYDPALFSRTLETLSIETAN